MIKQRTSENIRKIDVFKDGHDIFRNICKKLHISQISFLQSIFFSMKNNQEFKSILIEQYTERWLKEN